MKRNKFLLLAFAVAAMLTSCGGKQGGKWATMSSL